MNQSMMEMVAEAKKIVPAIAPDKAANLLDAGDAVAIDAEMPIKMTAAVSVLIAAGSRFSSSARARGR